MIVESNGKIELFTFQLVKHLMTGKEKQQK